MALHASSNSDTASITSNRRQVVPPLNFEQKEIWLPKGWTVVNSTTANRRKSLFELETNIRTLGELYRTLSDLRHQLPSPVAAAMEEQQQQQQPPPGTETSRKDDRRRSSILRLERNDTDTPSSTIGTPGTFRYFAQQLCGYPSSVFDALIRLHLECTTYLRIDRAQFVDDYYQGILHPALICAIFAYTAIHGMVSHPEQFGIYPFMDQLAHECYELAHDLIEFDVVSKTTVETLVLMHYYLVATSRSSQDHHRHLLALADRHTAMLIRAEEGKQKRQQEIQRLRAWLVQTDLLYAIRTNSAPVCLLPTPVQSIRAWLDLRPVQNHERHRLEALESEIEILLASLVYNRPTANNNTLRLQAITFACQLHHYQSQMMDAYARYQTEIKLLDDDRSDYFYQQPTTTTTASDPIESALLQCMQAAYGLAHVIRNCCKLNDRCLIIELLDILSAAYTVLYFGNKMIPTQSKDPAISLLDALASSSFMMESPSIRQFVLKWT